MKLPVEVNRQTLIDTLVTELAELEILYPDPEFMQKAIKAWSNRELPTWERIAKAAAAEYDPISNYDRHEEWTDKSDATATVVGYNDPGQTPSSGSKANGTHNGHIYGNVGVTTSQQMLEQELLLAPKLNVYNYIIASFRSRFCLLVY